MMYLEHLICTSGTNPNNALKRVTIRVTREMRFFQERYHILINTIKFTNYESSTGKPEMRNWFLGAETSAINP